MDTTIAKIKKLWLIRCGSVFALLLVAAMMCDAQVGTGSIRGVVTDPSGAACHPWTIVYHPVGEVHSHSVPLAGVRILIVEIGPQELPWIRECCRFAEDSMTSEGSGPGRIAARLYREFIHSDEVSPLVVEAYVLELLAD